MTIIPYTFVTNNDDLTLCITLPLTSLNPTRPSDGCGEQLLSGREP